MDTTIQTKNELDELARALIRSGYKVKLVAKNPKTKEVQEWPIGRLAFQQAQMKE